jgi:futalosine hydrolase
MKLLIIAATAGEILPLPPHITDKYSIDVLITGVGMVATTYAVAKQLQLQQYDFALQVGVCGSFDKGIPLGEVVLITFDRYGDKGAEDHDNYLDIFEMGLINEHTMPFTNGQLCAPTHPLFDKIGLRRVNAITVNTVSGNERTIKMRADKYGCTTESMEGAAFHYVCLQEKIPFAQVRAVSNYVIPRDKSQWKMKDAIINLNNWLIAFIESLNV